MAILDIVTFGKPVLRKKTIEITEITPELKQLAVDMLETMYDAPGVGLAAPQVAQSIRLFVVDVSSSEAEKKEPYVFFNPVITPETRPIEMEEGCLSVPGIYANVMRPEIITVTALDINGKPFELNHVEGLFSRCIQHEMDHLNGILFVDKISPSDRIMVENKLKKLAKKNK
jgi:peptide deformylase